MQNCREIYITDIEYKEISKELEIKYKNLLKKIGSNYKKELTEIKKLIYKLCAFDVHIAYKIGLIDGMKLKNKCIN